MFCLRLLQLCKFSKNVKFKPNFCKNGILELEQKDPFKVLRQPQLRHQFWWCSRNCQRSRILSTVRTDQDHLHNVFPHWETTRGSKLKKTQQKLQETKRIVSEKIESIENIWTIPNGLCLLRMGLTPVLGYMVVSEAYSTALGILIMAGVTDVLDGYIARNFANQQSMLGSFLDPMADKLLVATLFLTLTMEELIPVPLTALIIVRDVCLMSAAFHIRYKSLPPPRTLLRYFDATMPTANLSPTLISKVNTSVQLTLVAATLAAPVFNYVDHPYLHFLWYVTAATTVVSGLSYVVSKGTYTILTKSKQRKDS